MRRAIGVCAVLGVLGAGGAGGCASDPPPGRTPGNTTGNAGSGAAGTGAATAGTGGPSGNAGSTGATAGSSAAAGTGAAGTGAGPTAGSGAMQGDIDCAALALPQNTDDIISTFEDGTGNVMQVAGRGGGFYMFNDMSTTGMQTPPTGGLPDATAVDRCGSMFAMCMKGSGFTTWGAGMGTDFGPTMMGEDGMMVKSTYDASQYKGVAFWAKANPGSAVAVRVSLKDKNTAPEGGVCDPSVSSGAEACNDDWGKALNLTQEWQPYTVLFSELRQAAWGKAFAAFDATAVYSIQFQVSQNLEFDLCVDDLVFVR